MAKDQPPVVRRALPEDAPAIADLVCALADYEKLDRPAPEARERLIRDIFGDRPKLECWVAFVDDSAAGYAFAFETYSSFLALPTMYLEDLFVKPEYRGRKAGLALFECVLNEAESRGCGRMEWTVLDWNELAVNFYRKMGARHMREWHHYRITLEPQP
jgi:GNAT superfamily N-acetyltransferase